MNGTVAPPSSSATAAATCSSRTPSSWAIRRSIVLVTWAPVRRRPAASFHGDRVVDLRVEFVPRVLRVEALVSKPVLPDETRLRLVVDGDPVHRLAHARGLLPHVAHG